MTPVPTCDGQSRPRRARRRAPARPAVVVVLLAVGLKLVTMVGSRRAASPRTTTGVTIGAPPSSTGCRSST